MQTCILGLLFVGRGSARAAIGSPADQLTLRSTVTIRDRGMASETTTTNQMIKIKKRKDLSWPSAPRADTNHPHHVVNVL